MWVPSLAVLTSACIVWSAAFRGGAFTLCSRPIGRTSEKWEIRITMKRFSLFLIEKTSNFGCKMKYTYEWLWLSTLIDHNIKHHLNREHYAHVTLCVCVCVSIICMLNVQREEEGDNKNRGWEWDNKPSSHLCSDGIRWVWWCMTLVRRRWDLIPHDWRKWVCVKHDWSGREGPAPPDDDSLKLLWKYMHSKNPNVGVGGGIGKIRMQSPPAPPAPGRSGEWITPLQEEMSRWHQSLMENGAEEESGLLWEVQTA